VEHPALAAPREQGVELPRIELRARKEYRNQAWQVAMAWVLTGEKASYRGVLPRDSFSVEKGTFGAFELVSRP
jgi:hypothetical protein